MFLLILVGLDPLLVGPAARPRRDRGADRRALPLREPGARRDRPAGRDLLRLARRRLPRAGVRRAAGTQARPGRGRRAGSSSASACWRPRSIVVNLLGSYIGGRLDLTPGNAYTLVARHRPHRARPGRPRHREGVRVAGAAHRGRADEARRGRPAPRPALRRPRPGPHHRARPVRRRGRATRGRVARHPAGPVQRDRPGGAAGEAGLSGPRRAARRRRPRPSPSSSAPTTSSTGWPRPSGS